jgi:hypothetical protein
MHIEEYPDYILNPLALACLQLDCSSPALELTFWRLSGTVYTRVADILHLSVYPTPQFILKYYPRVSLPFVRSELLRYTLLASI